MFLSPSTTQCSDTCRTGNSLPSGEKATDVAEPVWPSSICNGAPVAASQSRTFSSRDPDTTCLPSGEKATELTQSVWPSSVCRETWTSTNGSTSLGRAATEHSLLCYQPRPYLCICRVGLSMVTRLPKEHISLLMLANVEILATLPPEHRGLIAV